MKTKLTINLVLALAIVSCVPDGAMMISLASLLFANIALHYRSLGGRWNDDWERTTVNPNYFKHREWREMMQSYCLCYRSAAILAALMLVAAVVKANGWSIEL